MFARGRLHDQAKSTATWNEKRRKPCTLSRIKTSRLRSSPLTEGNLFHCLSFPTFSPPYPHRMNGSKISTSLKMNENNLRHALFPSVHFHLLLFLTPSRYSSMLLARHRWGEKRKGGQLPRRKDFFSLEVIPPSDPHPSLSLLTTWQAADTLMIRSNGDTYLCLHAYECMNTYIHIYTCVQLDAMIRVPLVKFVFLG